MITLQSIDSTNTYATELLSKSNPSEGTTVFTHNQYGGKGQFGRKWASRPFENLTLSIILKPKFLELDKNFYLNIITSLAIVTCIENIIDKEIFIKWPNDIYIRNKKTCGILVENIIQGRHLQNSVIGIGINVNQLDFDESLPNPTSLRKELKRELDLESLLFEVLENLEFFYLKLKRGEFVDLVKQYTDRLYLKDQRSEFNLNNRSTNGTIRGIDNLGRLVIQTANEEVHATLNELEYIMK